MLDVTDASGKVVDVKNDLFSKAAKQKVVLKFVGIGEKLDQELKLAALTAGRSSSGGGTGGSSAEPTLSPPRKEPRLGVMERARAARQAAGGAPASAPANTAFKAEFDAWRQRDEDSTPMAVFWSSELAKLRFPIMRRLFLSVCSARPDNAEAERDFSAMTRLLSPARRGRMSASTVARKLFLALNSDWWVPCPELVKDDYYIKVLASIDVAAWGVWQEGDSSESDDEE